MNKQLNIFAIYTWEDKNVLLHVLRELKSFKEKNNVTIWDDNPINAKEKWVPKDESHINNSDVFLFFISNDFMRSEFINQVEFKNIIDRYKANKTKVIPILVDDAPWNIDFKADDYNFNFNELSVLPDEEKPIENWEAPDQAFKNVAQGIQKAIVPSKSFSFTVANDTAVASRDEEETSVDPNMPEKRIISTIFDLPEDRTLEEQIKMDFALEAENIEKVKEDQKLKEEVAAKKRIAETHRLKVEDEANLKVGKEQQLSTEIETKRMAQIEQERLVEVERKRKEELERERLEVAARKREKELELERLEELIVNREQEQSDENNEEYEVEANITEDYAQSENTSKRKLLIGSLIALVVIAGIWLFSSSDSNTETQEATPAEKELQKTVDSNPFDEKVTTPVSEEKSVFNAEVGKTYEGGIIFSYDETTKTGKIIYAKDSGKMPYINAKEMVKTLGEGWRLPTIEELVIMQKTVGPGGTNIGEFTDGIYWSVTPYDANQARLARFSDGNTTFHYNNRATYRKFQVRAVRDFEK